VVVEHSAVDERVSVFTKEAIEDFVPQQEIYDNIFRGLEETNEPMMAVQFPSPQRKIR